MPSSLQPLPPAASISAFFSAACCQVILWHDMFTCLLQLVTHESWLLQKNWCWKAAMLSHALLQTDDDMDGISRGPWLQIAAAVSRQREGRAAHNGDLVGTVHPAAHSGAGYGRVLKLQRDALALRLDGMHLSNRSISALAVRVRTSTSMPGRPRPGQSLAQAHHRSAQQRAP